MVMPVWMFAVLFTLQVEETVNSKTGEGGEKMAREALCIEMLAETHVSRAKWGRPGRRWATLRLRSRAGVKLQQVLRGHSKEFGHHSIATGGMSAMEWWLPMGLLGKWHLLSSENERTIHIAIELYGVETSQSPKVIHCIVAFIQHCRDGKTVEMENRLVVESGEEGVRGGREVGVVTKGRHTGREVCTPMFTAALLAVAKGGSDPRAHRQTNGRIKCALCTW